MIRVIKPRACMASILNQLNTLNRTSHVITGQRRLMATDVLPKEKSNSSLGAKEKPTAPVKFTTSQAYLNYRSTENFHGHGDDQDLPNSHNLVLSGSFIFGITYLIMLRDDIEADGGVNLFKPLHETMPNMAIPLIRSAITENKKFGLSTEKLEKKLQELMKEPEKHGLRKDRKLVEN